MEVKIEPHTLERAEERGADITEIEDVLLNGIPLPAKSGRQMKAKVYPFNQQRLGKFYKEKRIEVIYVIEENKLVTVTVYVFYGEWKD